MSIEKRAARVALLKAKWQAGLPLDTVTFDLPKLDIGWWVSVGRGQNVHFLFNERVTEWLFEDTEGYRAIARRFGPWISEISIAVQFKNARDTVHFKLRWL